MSRTRAELGFRLRSQRHLIGKTQSDVARAAGMSRAKLSRIEQGAVSQSEYDVRRLAEALALSPDLTDQLTLQARAIRRQEARLGAPPACVGQDEVADLEKHTTLRQEVGSTIIPGILQTPSYASAALTHGIPQPPSYVPDPHHRLHVRMARQAALYDLSKQFSFVITELALRIPRIDRESMIDQYRHLSNAAKRPNVEIDVIPTCVMRWCPVGFSICDKTVVVVNAHHADMLVDEPGAVASYVEIYEQLRSTALRGQEAIEFLDALS